jgi:hypothetical protein
MLQLIGETVENNDETVIKRPKTWGMKRENKYLQNEEEHQVLVTHAS